MKDTDVENLRAFFDLPEEDIKNAVNEAQSECRQKFTEEWNESYPGKFVLFYKAKEILKQRQQK